MLCALGREEVPADYCQLVVVVARSHSVLIADVGKKRRANASALEVQKNVYSFDYPENETMLKVSMFCVGSIFDHFLIFRIVSCPSAIQSVPRVTQSLGASGMQVTHP